MMTRKRIKKMTEIEEKAIQKRKAEMLVEKRRAAELMQEALKDYVDGKVSFNELPKNVQFFLIQNTVTLPDSIFGKEPKTEKKHEWW